MAFYNVRCPFRLANTKIGSFGFDIETPTSLDDTALDDIADTVTTEWQSNVALFSADMELLPATVQGFERVQDSAGPPPVAHREPTTTLHEGAGAAVDGTAAGQSAAPQIALVVTFRTGSPERRALGRCYTPPPPESVIDGTGQISDAATRATMVVDIIAAAEGAIAPVDVDHIVFSTRYGDQNEVISYSANQTADTQRRRATR